MIVKIYYIKLVQVLLFLFLDLFGGLLEGVHLIGSKLFNIFKIATVGGAFLTFLTNPLPGQAKFGGLKMAFWLVPSLDFILFEYLLFSLFVLILAVVRLIVLMDD